MKNFFRFAAIAATMLTLCVACKKAGDQGTKEPLSIDGKQWCFECVYAGMAPATAVLDLSVSEKDFMVIGMNIPLMGMAEGTYMMSSAGNYRVEATDATSGKISAVDPDDPTASVLEINYSSLTEKSVVLSCTAEILQLDNVTATLAEEKIEIPIQSEM